MCLALLTEKKPRWWAIDENIRQCVAVWARKTDVSVERLYAIKFCVWLKKMVAETLRYYRWHLLLKLGESTMRRWHKDFKAGWESVELQLQGGVTVVTEVSIITVTVVMLTVSINTIRYRYEDDNYSSYPISIATNSSFSRTVLFLKNYFEIYI